MLHCGTIKGARLMTPGALNSTYTRQRERGRSERSRQKPPHSACVCVCVLVCMTYVSELEPNTTFQNQTSHALYQTCINYQQCQNQNQNELYSLCQFTQTNNLQWQECAYDKHTQILNVKSRKCATV